MTETLKVAIRVRPPLPNEASPCSVRVTENQVMVGNGRCFAFDTVFGMEASSDDVYVAVGQPLANSFLDGFNVSTIAYGQTGAGKTFTMSLLSEDVVQEVFCRLEEEAAQAAERQEADLGFTMRVSALEVYNESVGDLLYNKAATLRHVPGVTVVGAGNGAGGSQPSSSAAPSPINGSIAGSSTAASVRPRKASVASGASPNLSYGGGGGPALALREDAKGGVYVAGLSEYDVQTAEALLACIDGATANRKTAATLMNTTSSRSHCVVTLTLQRKGIVSRCCFVDLAGSERFKKSLGIGSDLSASSPLSKALNAAINTGAGGSSGGSSGGGVAAGSIDQTLALDGVGDVVMERMREGISINGGLLALGNVIVALCEKKAHVPYRSSKLTRLLQPMLGGNSRTAMVACISPLESSIEETLNTLKYANRAKSIKTNPHLIADVSSVIMNPEEVERIILSLRKELEETQQQLAQALSGNPVGPRRLLRTASAGCAPTPPRSQQQQQQQQQQRRSNSAAPKEDNTAPNAPKRGRSGTHSRKPSRGRGSQDAASSPATTTPPRHHGGGGGNSTTTSNNSRQPTVSAAEAAAMLHQIAELQRLLAQEKAVTKRLEEDLFNAEYTSMIETEKRRAAEERVLELECLMTPNEEGSAHSLTPIAGSPAESPRTCLTQNAVLLKRLEEERDSLRKLKAQKEEAKVRLTAVLSENHREAAAGDGDGNGDDDGSKDDDNSCGDVAIAELTGEIEAKSQQITALEQQNEAIMQQLQQYEKELEVISTEKSRLQEELAKAEERLERSQLDRQRKDAERARLQAEYRERLRKVEEQAADYRRRVRKAQQDVKMRYANMQQIDLLKREMLRLREEAARQKAGKRAELRKTAKQQVAHTQEMALLAQQLRDTEQQVVRLQGNLKRKDSEIAHIKARMLSNLPHGVASARELTLPGPLTSEGFVIKQPPARLSLASAPQSHHNGNNNNNNNGNNNSSWAASLSGNGDVQSQIDNELQKLGRLEKELQELQDCRQVLSRTQSTDAPKYESALKGFAKRLQYIDGKLGGHERAYEPGSPESPSAPLTEAEKSKLMAEREDIKTKLRKLEKFQRMSEEAKQQLEDFDDRIDSLNETRRYHLHRVRSLQRARTSGVAADLSPASTVAAAGGGGGGSSFTVSPPPTNRSTAPTAPWDSIAQLPSVREITTARMRNGTGSSRWLHKHRETSGFLEAVPSFTATDKQSETASHDHGGLDGSGVLESKTRVSQRRYIRQLEETVKLLEKEADSLRAQVGK